MRIHARKTTHIRATVLEDNGTSTLTIEDSMLKVVLKFFSCRGNSFRKSKKSQHVLSIGSFVNSDVMALAPSRISSETCNIRRSFDENGKALGER